jgi:hypothetical protein
MGTPETRPFWWDSGRFKPAWTPALRPGTDFVTGPDAWAKPEQSQQFSFWLIGRARHSVRAAWEAHAGERRARSDAPYLPAQVHNENCWSKGA